MSVSSLFQSRRTVSVASLLRPRSRRGLPVTVVSTRRLVCFGITVSAVTLLFGGVDSSMALPICAVMYWDEGYRGEQRAVLAEQSTVYVGAHWNDRMSSIQVRRGCSCTIYRDSGYLGGSRTFDGTAHGIDVPWLGDEWNGQVSSIRCTAP